MEKALRILRETPTDHGYVVREEYWQSVNFKAEVISDPQGDGEAGAIASAINENHPSSDELHMVTCYTNDGFWIGDQRRAQYLCEELGIRPIPHPKTERGALLPCSIGFCEKEQKWFGWSHRAICGFGVGDIVKEGDCTASSGWTAEYLAEHPEADKSLPVGFKAENLDDAKRMAIAFADSVG